MKTIKELLQLVYDYERKEKCTGLCDIVLTIRNKFVITEQEYFKLKEYIKNNKPENASKQYPLWFPMFDWKPRNKWLLKHINLNK